MSEEQVRQALQDLDPLWEELFPSEQTRIVQLLVERVDIGTQGFDLRLRVDGLADLARDLSSAPPIYEKQQEHVSTNPDRAGAIHHSEARRS